MGNLHENTASFLQRQAFTAAVQQGNQKMTKPFLSNHIPRTKQYLYGRVDRFRVNLE